MKSSIFGVAATATALLLGRASAQTWSKCNPLYNTCPPNTALGMTVNIDFRKGPVNSFAASGTPSYSTADGVSFSVSRGGDAPQLQSLFSIMFGRVEITMRAAPGAGIVSSLVLESDDLDEIDMEWLGSNPDEMQSNYFGKGQTTTYNRGRFHAVPGTQARWITYAVDWTSERIVWTADGKVVREQRAEDAAADQYPQTPMQVKFGAWAGGDPATNAPGTVAWARGPTDFSKGPFSMLVRSVVIADYSTGKQYRYKDTSGSWESIEAVGGRINGNGNGNGNGLSPPPPAETPGVAPAPIPVPVPVGGIAKDGSSATATQTGWPWVASATPGPGTIPEGWHMTPSGKIMRDPTSSAPASASASIFALASTAAALLSCRLHVW
ncbi:hypothetical protein E4U43_008263 [Claviceps pusilla]|uniref:GH16 domain-containing protein n=1 Tax=Claviceps pusilla TaxID=123648 RepID=A0A9P7SYE2_9HYPO|nr:hypothetical protein E4U43_008263 [Claviceps pusilla]